MTKRVDVNINGKAYPCRMTMGAMLRFKRETGKDITAITGEVSDMCVLLYCCLVSACNADKVEFDMSLDDFADSISPDDLNAWQEALNLTNETETTEENSAKKKR